MTNRFSVIQWGILSTGRMADGFATDFLHVEGANLVAVASRSQDRAEDFARKHGILRAYGTYQELLEDPDVDVVYIGTPHNRHLRDARQAMAAGKAVLCEKPLTVNPDECRNLIAVSERTGVYLMEAMWTWFLPAVQRAKEWVEAGRIGRIRHLKADFGYPQAYDSEKREYNVTLGGGALLEMGIYPVALAWYFLRQDPSRVKVVSRRAPNGVEDDVVAVFDYADEEGEPSTVATLATSFRCKLQNWAYIVGDEGYIAIPDFWRARECSLYVLDERVDHFQEEREHQGFCHEARAVNDDLRQGRRESSVVQQSDSLKFQEHMARIRAHF